MSIPLTPEEAKILTFQEYGSPGEIEGVFHTPLKKHRGLEGWLMEYVRLDGGAIESLPIEFQVRQVSFSQAAPGRINAFHVHTKRIQDELWCVMDGTMLAWLVDIRADSPTAGRRRRYVLSAESPGMLHVPTGVAHGYQAGHEGALLVYAANGQFDPTDPNEGRLPWDHFGAELWEADRG